MRDTLQKDCTPLQPESFTNVYSCRAAVHTVYRQHYVPKYSSSTPYVHLVPTTPGIGSAVSTGAAVNTDAHCQVECLDAAYKKSRIQLLL